MFKRILIATDGSKNGEKAAKSGIELAKLSGGKVIIVYVADIGKYMPSAGIISPFGPFICLLDHLDLHNADKQAVFV